MGWCWFIALKGQVMIKLHIEVELCLIYWSTWKVEVFNYFRDCDHCLEVILWGIELLSWYCIEGKCVVIKSIFSLNTHECWWWNVKDFYNVMLYLGFGRLRYPLLDKSKLCWMWSLELMSVIMNEVYWLGRLRHPPLE